MVKSDRRQDRLSYPLHAVHAQIDRR
jgi:hypothetical protein